VGQDGTLRRVGNPSPDWLMGLADCQLLQDVILPNKLRNSISLVARTRGCQGPFIAAPNWPTSSNFRSYQVANLYRFLARTVHPSDNPDESRDTPFHESGVARPPGNVESTGIPARPKPKSASVIAPYRQLFRPDGHHWSAGDAPRSRRSLPAGLRQTRAMGRAPRLDCVE